MRTSHRCSAPTASQSLRRFNVSSGDYMVYLHIPAPYTCPTTTVSSLLFNAAGTRLYISNSQIQFVLDYPSGALVANYPRPNAITDRTSGSCYGRPSLKSAGARQSQRLPVRVVAESGRRHHSTAACRQCVACHCRRCRAEWRHLAGLWRSGSEGVRCGALRPTLRHVTGSIDNSSSDAQPPVLLCGSGALQRDILRLSLLR